MNRSFSIRKIHRYLSIFIAIQLLLWTISGIYFAFNKIELIRGEQYRLPLDKEFRIFTRLDQQIIEENINGIKTYSTYPDGKKINVLTQEEALVIAKIKTSLIPINATLITEDSAGSEYRGRPLPLYKISTDTKDKINTFVSIFPASKPKYVLLILLDEPKPSKEYIYHYRDGRLPYKGNWRNTAGWTSVEIAGKIIEKIGPILATKYIEVN